MKKQFNQLIKSIVPIALLLAISFVACSDNESYSYSSNDTSYGSGKGGSMARFTIKGDYLYTVDNNTLKTFDVATASKPMHLSSRDQNVGFGIETIFTMDTLMFIGSQDAMYIYNITRPEFPQQISKADHFRSCDPVVAQGNYAYVTLNTANIRCGANGNVLNIYDITNPYKPLFVREERLNAPRGLGIDGDKLFICDRGVKVYDISKDPTKPQMISDLEYIPEAKRMDAYDLIPMDGTLIVTGSDGLYQFDYTKEKLAFVSKIEIKRE